MDQLIQFEKKPDLLNKSFDLLNRFKRRKTADLNAHFTKKVGKNQFGASYVAALDKKKWPLLG